MGIWNSHTSVGNILGSAIPGIWASNEWWVYKPMLRGTNPHNIIKLKCSVVVICCYNNIIMKGGRKSRVCLNLKWNKYFISVAGELAGVNPVLINFCKLLTLRHVKRISEAKGWTKISECNQILQHYGSETSGPSWNWSLSWSSAGKNIWG